MNDLELARKLAYKHLKSFIEKNNEAYDYSKNPETTDYMLAMDFLLNTGNARFATPEEYQAASILEEILAIEAYPNLDEILENETRTMREILYSILKKKITTLEIISDKGISATFTGKTKSLKPRERQLSVIADAIKFLDYNSMAIPDGGKSLIREICLKQPKYFISVHAFNGAWKDGRKENLFQMANIEKFKTKK